MRFVQIGHVCLKKSLEVSLLWFPVGYLFNPDKKNLVKYLDEIEHKYIKS